MDNHTFHFNQTFTKLLNINWCILQKNSVRKISENLLIKHWQPIKKGREHQNLH